jgi:hypothetical protein
MSANTTKPDRSQPVTSKLQSYPLWAPRFWHGMPTGVWFDVLARGRFRIHPVRLVLAFTVSCASPVNSVLRRLQGWRYGRQIEETEIAEPPVFVIGHWRSGTTYLHELLCHDDRFAYPTTYECFAPSHFLVSAWILPRLLGFLLPRKRPMDNMLAGFDRPQEDEFALSNLGCPTPYLRMVFPNEAAPYQELLDMQGVPDDVLASWKRHVMYFVKALTLQKRKPLILKSPPHTGRIAVLSEMFPGARFIHITRDPFTLFASTRRLWPALDGAQALQLPRNKYLDEYVFSCFERMYRGFEQQRPLIPPQHICDVRYEDLVRDPLGQMQGIYEKLALGDFERVRGPLETYLQQHKDYQTNRHIALDEGLRAEIRRRWGSYAEKYGYVEEPAGVP